MTDLQLHSLFSLARRKIDQRSVVRVPHLGVYVLLQLLLPTVSVGLQHHLVGDHQVLLDGLDEDLGSQVTRDLSDVNILGEGCSPGQILIIDQLHQSLSSLVDHSIGDHTCLTKSSSQSQAREDVPSNIIRLISVPIMILLLVSNFFC